MCKTHQCSYQHAASVLCRAWLDRDFVGKLWETIPTCLKCMPYNFPSTKMLRQTMSIFANQERTQQLELCICKKYFTISQRRFLMNFVRAKTISGPKNPIMAASGQSPKTHICFTGSHGLITVFLQVNCGFLKAGVLFKIRKCGFSMG